MPHACLLLLTAALVCALDDFERPEAGITGLGAAQITLVPAPAGGGSGSALSLAWPEQHARWIECVYAKPRPVVDLAPGMPVVLRGVVWLEPVSGARSFSVRLLDARHETWQWTTPLVPTAAGGWRAFAVPLTLEQANGHWGGDNDGVAQPPLRLSGFSVAFASQQVPAGTVLLDDLACQTLLSARLETERFPNQLDPGGRCELLLGNRQDRELVVEARVSATDWADVRSEASIRIALPPGGETRVALPVGSRSGLHRLTWDLLVDGLHITGRGTVAVTTAVPPGDRDGFRFGICSHTESKQPVEQERELRAAAAAGASVVRCGDYWSSIEPKPGEWRWDNQDRLVDVATSLGLEMQPILGFCANHAASPAAQAATAAGYRAHDPNAWKLSAMSPPEDAPWRRYVAAMATRYRGRIRMYEVWNEPDLGFWRGTTAAYIGMLRAAAEEVHRADPQAEVLTGGFATALVHAGRATNPDLQERVLAEASDAYDVHAFHGHGPFEEFVRGLTMLDGWRARQTVARPLYFNETALASYGGGAAAERTQAVELVKKMSYAVSLGALGYTWYELRNGGTSATDSEHQYGLLSHDLQPKPAFCAYAETVRRLRGARPLGRLDLGPGIYGLAFAQAQRRIVVLWHEDRTVAEDPIIVRVGTGTARICDLMGAGEALPVLDGVVVVQPSADPVFLELPAGEVAPVVVGRLVRLAGATTVQGDQPAVFTAVVTNPLPRPVVVRLTWSDAHSAVVERSVPIDADGASEMQLTTRIARAGAASVALAWTVEGTPWHGTLRQPLRLVHDVQAGDPDGRAPDFTLADVNDVVSFCRADPQLAAQVWRGPGDLSARIWLTHRPGELRLRVDVRDDVHRQREDAVGQWRGDGVQFAFQVPSGSGCWELGMARQDDGTVLRTVWLTPPGAAPADFAVTVHDLSDGLRYEAILPLERFALSDAQLAEGLRFNLIVNDNDGPLREGFVRIAPGIGESKDPSAFPIVRFRGPGE